MAFNSSDIEKYLKIINDPKWGLKYLEKKNDQNNDQNNSEESDNEDDNEDDEEDNGNINNIKNEDTCMDDVSIDDEDETKLYDQDLYFQITDVDNYEIEDDNGKKEFNMNLFGKTGKSYTIFLCGN